MRLAWLSTTNIGPEYDQPTGLLHKYPRTLFVMSDTSEHVQVAISNVCLKKVPQKEVAFKII